jgi:hypothetical protein
MTNPANVRGHRTSAMAGIAMTLLTFIVLPSLQRFF